jgi:hypothetical protein
VKHKAYTCRKCADLSWFGLSRSWLDLSHELAYTPWPASWAWPLLCCAGGRRFVSCLGVTLLHSLLSPYPGGKLAVSILQVATGVIPGALFVRVAVLAAPGCYTSSLHLFAWPHHPWGEVCTTATIVCSAHGWWASMLRPPCCPFVNFNDLAGLAGVIWPL